jgi:endonuclease/exonuclease/phosphatase family metal-dependent hydrolase
MESNEMESLRIVSWNCRVGGFRYKSAKVAVLRADILAVQEVSHKDVALVFSGVEQPTYRNQILDPAYPRRSIGVYSYTDANVRAVDETAPFYSFRRFVVNKGLLEFNVAAVWTAATNDVATSYLQAHDGIDRYAKWIQERPTIILGDLNMDASYTRSALPRLVDSAKKLGLVSAYHDFFGEQFGSESRHTYFYRGRSSGAYHLDYCFVPRSWVQFIQMVTVGEHAEWENVSDHVPVIVDMAIPSSDAFTRGGRTATT